MRLVLIVAILIGLATVVTLGFTIDRFTLTSAEKTQALDACSVCHRYPERLNKDADSVHRIHSNAECMKCHSGVSGLETADKAHDVLEWTGIGAAATTVAGLGLNYFVAKRKLLREGKE